MFHVLVSFHLLSYSSLITFKLLRPINTCSEFLMQLQPTKLTVSADSGGRGGLKGGGLERCNLKIRSKLFPTKSGIRNQLTKNLNGTLDNGYHKIWDASKSFFSVSLSM